MSFKQVNDGLAGRHSRVYKYAAGTHFGHSPCDQPAQYAYITDLDCYQNQWRLRPGHRKNEQIGYYGDVQGVINVNIFDIGLAGFIVNGNLSLYPVQDIIDGKQKFHTWDEVKKVFTWETIQDKTWRDIVTGR